VDIVEDEEKTTQHTVITKVQVQKQQTIHHELVVEQSAANHQLDAETEADIDVDGDCDADRDRDRDNDRDRDRDRDGKSLLDDNNSYLSDSRRLSFDADDQEHHSASISPVLGGSSSVASSSQHDSNSLEELPIAGSTTNLTCPLPLAMTMSLPKAYVELNHVDPHILSSYKNLT